MLTDLIQRYRPLPLQPGHVSDTEFDTLMSNIQCVRDAIILFTAVAGAKGLGGHTGGAYDIVPEAMIIESLRLGGADIDSTFYDEAGHRAAFHYALAAIRGDLEPDRLLHYREASFGLPGHPESDHTPGVGFSSGRLGHMWAFANGIAYRNRSKVTCLFGSDGSQQEGNNAEAARLAVQNRLNIKLIIDDNDVTISGHPSEYMPSFNMQRTLEGHGLDVRTANGEDTRELFHVLCDLIVSEGPMAFLVKRPMAPNVPGIEGKTSGHDVIKLDSALAYFDMRGNDMARDFLQRVYSEKFAETYFWDRSNQKNSKNRDAFGSILAALMGEEKEKRNGRQTIVIDSDLEGSCGLHHIKKSHPELYVQGGIMERGNFSLAAGFGAVENSQGVFGTFSAFSEMVISELTMARLNKTNMLCHFSHSGVDDMADNTCHFGINNFFLDGEPVSERTCDLYFPADEIQLKNLLEDIFLDDGVRIVMSTRSSVPTIWNEKGEDFFAAHGAFKKGKDDIIRDGSEIIVISYGDMLHRCLDAVDKLRADGRDISLVNKCHLNIFDTETFEKISSAKACMVFESQNQHTGLGVRFSSEIHRREIRTPFKNFGVTRHGIGGLGEQIAHQELTSIDVMNRINEFAF